MFVRTVRLSELPYRKIDLVSMSEIFPIPMMWFGRKLIKLKWIGFEPMSTVWLSIKFNEKQVCSITYKATKQDMNDFMFGFLEIVEKDYY